MKWIDKFRQKRLLRAAREGKLINFSYSRVEDDVYQFRAMGTTLLLTEMETAQIVATHAKAHMLRYASRGLPPVILWREGSAKSSKPKFGRLRRIAGLFALVIPAARRHEIVGDFHESCDLARSRGYGWLSLKFLISCKAALYLWVGLGLRFTDFKCGEQQNERETPE